MNRDFLTTTIGMNLRYCKSLIADIADADFCKQTSGIVNHPAWTMGHLCAVNGTALGLLGRDSVMEEGLARRFGRGSVPEADRSSYPAKEEFWSLFEKQMQSLSEGVNGVDDSQLEAPMPLERLAARFPRVGDAVVYMTTAHPAIHLGQLSAWRRAMGMGPTM